MKIRILNILFAFGSIPTVAHENTPKWYQKTSAQTCIGSAILFAGTSVKGWQDAKTQGYKKNYLSYLSDLACNSIKIVNSQTGCLEKQKSPLITLSQILMVSTTGTATVWGLGLDSLSDKTKKDPTDNDDGVASDSDCESDSDELSEYDFASDSDQSQTNDKISLESHLAKPRIPCVIQHLVKTAQKKLKGQPYKDRKKFTLFGGRSFGWIKKTFGIPEQEIRTALQQAHNEGNLQSLPTWTVAEIDAHLTEQLTKPRKADNRQIFVVQGFGVNGLAHIPMGKHAIVQLASQLNYLESPSTELKSVESYCTDPTQGPAGVMEAAAATMHRDALVRSDQLPHALTNVLSDNLAQKCYRNGYLEPLKLKAASEQQELLSCIQKNKNNLDILAQWVMTEGSDATQLHVLAGAPSFQANPGLQGSGAIPTINSSLGQICTELVVPQYEAIAQLAVLRSLQTDQPVPLHLTLVGQGAFNNPPEVMDFALARVAEITDGFNINVFIHGYGSVRPISNALNKAHVDFETLSAEQLKRLKN